MRSLANFLIENEIDIYEVKRKYICDCTICSVSMNGLCFEYQVQGYEFTIRNDENFEYTVQYFNRDHFTTELNRSVSFEPWSESFLELNTIAFLKNEYNEIDHNDEHRYYLDICLNENLFLTINDYLYIDDDNEDHNEIAEVYSCITDGRITKIENYIKQYDIPANW